MNLKTLLIGLALGALLGVVIARRMPCVLRALREKRNELQSALMVAQAQRQYLID